MADGTDIFGPAYLEYTLLINQGALGLRERRLGLRHIGAGDFADTETVLGGLELLAQDLDVVAVDLEQGLVANHVEIGLSNRLEDRGLHRQGLRPGRLYGIDRLSGLRLERGCRYADLAGEGDLGAPKRQSLRDLLVSCSQQCALREELRIGVVSLS